MIFHPLPCPCTVHKRILLPTKTLHCAFRRLRARPAPGAACPRSDSDHNADAERAAGAAVLGGRRPPHPWVSCKLTAGAGEAGSRSDRPRGGRAAPGSHLSSPQLGPQRRGRVEQRSFASQRSGYQRCCVGAAARPPKPLARTAPCAARCTLNAVCRTQTNTHILLTPPAPPHRPTHTPATPATPRACSRPSKRRPCTPSWRPRRPAQPASCTPAHLRRPCPRPTGCGLTQAAACAARCSAAAAMRACSSMNACCSCTHKQHTHARALPHVCTHTHTRTLKATKLYAAPAP